MSAQDQQNSPEYPHFALIYIDRQGNLRHESSLSVANSRETILSPLVTDEFLRAVQRSSGAPPSGATPSHSQFELGAPPTYHRVTSGQTPVSTQIGNIRPGPERRALDSQSRGLLAARNPTQPPVWSAPQGPGDWSRWSGQHPIPQPQQRPWGMEPNMRGSQKAFISIRDKDFLRRYYEKVFQNLQQTNCRVLAKAYVKLVEPRKQVNFPYNGRKIVAGQTQQLDPDDTKPPWWPTGVSHREPDHLPKAERIRLLVHILCELRTSYGITARKLKASDQPIRRQILPVERLEILDEVYQVREEEEKFSDQVTDGKAMVSISRSNLPDAAEALVNRGEQKQKPAPIIEEDPSPEPKTETMPVIGGPSRANPPQPIFVTGGDIPNPQPSVTPSPTRYIHQDLPIHPSFNQPPASSSISPQVKRKRQDSGPDVATTLSPTTMGYYSPIFVGSQPFMTEPYAGMQGFQTSGVTSQDMTPGQSIPEPFREPMENYEFPYYFEN
ncbi:unnamed protein product [Penicillium pancosmium]